MRHLREAIPLVVLEKFSIHLVLDFLRHKILKASTEHSKFPNSRGADVHSRAAGHEENCLLATQLAINDTH